MDLPELFPFDLDLFFGGDSPAGGDGFVVHGLEGGGSFKEKFSPTKSQALTRLVSLDLVVIKESSRIEGVRIRSS